MILKGVGDRKISCDCCPDNISNQSTCVLVFSVYGDSVWMCDPCYLKMKKMFKSMPD
jgi:hypothetical protein